MDYHDAIWKSIGHLATNNNTSCSGLAKMCGLDATVFNHSKRMSAYGQPRWISTSTLAKVLSKTQTSPKEFAEILQHYLDIQSQDK